MNITISDGIRVMKQASDTIHNKSVLSVADEQNMSIYTVYACIVCFEICLIQKYEY